MRRVEYKWECVRCGMIITTSSSFHPDKRAGGPCPKNPRGEHGWISRGRTG